MKPGLRIIAGQYRGRRLVCPKEGTRPTLDRVREALFSILGDVSGASVVDLYAGSGALGLEALSRGARTATIVESDRAACATIVRNARTLGAVNCKVVHTRAEEARRALEAAAPLDLVLSDPPWAIAQEALCAIGRVVRGLLAPGATVVVGHAARDRLEVPAGLELEPQQDRTWGDSGLLLLKQVESPLRGRLPRA